MIDYSWLRLPANHRKLFLEGIEEDSLEDLKLSLFLSMNTLTIIMDEVEVWLRKGRVPPELYSHLKHYEWMYRKLSCRIDEIEESFDSGSSSTNKVPKSKRQRQARKRRRRNK